LYEAGQDHGQTRERISTVDLLIITDFVNQTGYLIDEFNCSELSPHLVFLTWTNVLAYLEQMKSFVRFKYFLWD
jgi:hypothetical protein